MLQVRRITLLATVSLALAACSSTSDSSPATSPVSPESATDPVVNPLPAPSGPLPVGVVDLQRSATVAYYPAVASTGHGPRLYASPALLGVYGVTAEGFEAIIPFSQILAEPVRDAGPRPVVILAPGGGSFVELSTSLAEELASNGYVVITLQPDVAADGLFNIGDGNYSVAETNLIATATDEMRLAQIEDAIDLLADPLTTELVGPVDLARIAVGGHSYAGSTAFNASLLDPRITSVFDLDGTLFGDAGVTPVSVPSLVVMADLYNYSQEPPEGGWDPAVTDSLADILRSNELVRTAPNIVAVGFLGSDHYSVTDLPAIVEGLPEPVRSSALEGAGAIGRAGTIDTNTIVLRFLNAALAPEPRLATAAELVEGLPSTTADPLALNG
jgi:dienelactone hydrolase